MPVDVVHIRPARLKDAPALAAAYEEAWRNAYQGIIFELYLRPIYQGFGLGEKLFDGARMRLAELRLKGLLVWALADNDSACGFYLRLRGQPGPAGAASAGQNPLRNVAALWS